jgi:hypothetical protein
LLAIVAASVLLHVGVAQTLNNIVRVRESELAKRMAEREARETVEFEVVKVPPAGKPPAAKAAAAAAAPPQDQPPPTIAPTRIVELPKAPEQVPDKANYLAERNMRADKETIARKLGEAENRRAEGVANGRLSSEAAQAKVEARAQLEQREGSTGPAERGTGAAAEDRAADTGGDTLAAGGDGLLLRPGAPDRSPGTRRGGGGQLGLPEVKGKDALLPSQQQLARLLEPAQKNLLPVQHGDITVLNARSSEVATYVIASAKRIYSFLTINGPLLTVYYDDVRDLRFPVAVEATIDRRGKIVEMSLLASSGSGKIDRLISDAAKSGLASGTAPPAETFTEGDVMKFRFALYDDHIEAGMP